MVSSTTSGKEETPAAATSPAPMDDSAKLGITDGSAKLAELATRQETAAAKVAATATATADRYEILDIAADMHEADNLEKYRQNNDSNRATTASSSNQQETTTKSVDAGTTTTCTQSTGAIQNEGIRDIIITMDDDNRAVPPLRLQRDPVRRSQLSQPGAYSGGGEAGVLERNTTLDYELLVAATANDAPPALSIPTGSNNNDTTAAAAASAHTPDADLAVANAVTDATDTRDLEHANPVDLNAAAQRKLDDKKRQQRFFVAGLIWVLLIVGLAVGFTISKQNQSDSAIVTDAPTVYGSMIPSEVPSSAPSVVLDSLLDVLPNYTQESLKVWGSPQYQAWEWLSNHPNITFFAEWRKIQLFAMATTFFSLEGENWWHQIQERWVDYTLEECNWLSQGVGDFYGNPLRFTPFPWANPPCNELGQFTSLILRQLGLDGVEDLKPSIPQEIQLLTSLETIELRDCSIKARLSKFLPSELYRMPNITSLNLLDNNLFGAFPTELGLMAKLTTLALGSNPLTGHIPSELSLLPELAVLQLSDNGFTGSVPSHLWSLTSLTYLGIAANLLSGEISSDIGRLSNLSNLNLQINQFAGSFPSEFGMLASLTSLAAFDNFFSGSLPTEIQLVPLQVLYLKNNSITGALPTNLTNLQYLDLSNNNFEGTIASEIGRLDAMKYLRISGQPLLNGPIPSELGLLTATTFLDLHGCSLSGTIPTELGMMTSAANIRLYNNKLTGVLPSQLQEDVGWRLDGNNFSGAVPEHLCSAFWCDCSENATHVSTCYDLSESLDWPGRFPTMKTEDSQDEHLFMFNFYNQFYFWSQFSWFWKQETNETNVWTTLQSGISRLPRYLHSSLFSGSPGTSYKLQFIGVGILFGGAYVTLTSNGTVLYSMEGHANIDEIEVEISIGIDGSLVVTPTVKCSIVGC